MNNLKRVLSLALTSVMLIGTMAISAGAADFTDADKIEHSDAVNTLVALNIINGQDDGSFNPEGDVTRAQMAKMIAVALNGGTETNTGVKGTASFTDIKGHWAESYIEYCYDLGVINGRGDGTFDPEGKVTTIEATKMVLTALGYDAKAYELTGSKWATQTDQLARQAKPVLYEELQGGLVLNANATRDTAAQIIWNGLQNKTVRIQPDEGRSDGTISWNYRPTSTTLLEERFNAVVRHGYLTGVDYDKDSKVFTYSIDNTENFGADEIALYSSSNDESGVNGSFEYAEDVSDLFGQKVKVVYKQNKAKSVYSIFASDSTVLAEAVVGKDLQVDATDKSVKISGTTYKFSAVDATDGKTYETAAKVPVFNHLDSDSTENLDDLKGAAGKYIYAAKVIDNDNDGRVNCVVITPISVAKVTFVGKNSITAGTGVYKFEDCDIYEDVKKDDWAVITEGDFVGTGIDTVVKAETVNGEIEATREVGKEAKIDGTWYSDLVDANKDSIKTGDNYVVGEEFNLTVVNKYVINAEAVTSSADVSNAVYILQADAPGAAGSTSAGTQKVKLLFADDSSKIVTVDEINDSDVDSTNKAAVGDVYTFSVDKNGNYALSDIDDDDFDQGKDSADTGKAVTINEGRATGIGLARDYRFDADAVIFAKTTDGKVKAITGATVNKWKAVTTTTTATNTFVYADKNSNGFYCVRLGVLDLDRATVPNASGEKAYGWVTGKPEVVKSGDNWYVKVYIWNGSDNVELLTEESTSKIEVNAAKNKAEYQKGTPISYDDIGDGTMDNVVSLKTNINGVAGYSDGKDIEFRDVAGDTTARTGNITKDTVIIYVDMDDNVGAEGGDIVLAPTDANGVALNNVYAHIDNGDVEYIFVDVNNDIGSEYAVTASATSANITATRQGSGDVAPNATVTYRFSNSTSTAMRVKVTYGSQVKFVDVPATGTTVDVDFLQEVNGNAAMTIAEPVTVTKTDASDANGLSVETTVPTGCYVGDKAIVSVKVTGTATAAGSVKLTGVTEVEAITENAADGVTISADGKYYEFAQDKGSASGIVLEFEIVVEATTALTVTPAAS